MKKLCLIACVTVFAAFAAEPAKADVAVVRWNSGMCQIWDNAAGPPPWPAGEFAKGCGRFSGLGRGRSGAERTLCVRQVRLGCGGSASSTGGACSSASAAGVGSASGSVAAASALGCSAALSEAMKCKTPAGDRRRFCLEASSAL